MKTIYTKEIEKDLTIAIDALLEASYHLMKSVNYDDCYHPMNDEQLAYSKKLQALYKRVSKLRDEL